MFGISRWYGRGLKEAEDMREYRDDTSSGANDHARLHDCTRVQHIYLNPVLWQGNCGEAEVQRDGVPASRTLANWPTNYKFTTIGITQPPKDFLERATFRGDSLSIVSFVRLPRLQSFTASHCCFYPCCFLSLSPFSPLV